MQLINATNQSNLFNNNRITQLSERAPQEKKHFCSNKRRCYRLADCEYCRNRHRTYIVNQAIYFGERWSFTQFNTISYPGFIGTPAEAINYLACIRSALLDSFRKKSKYFTALGVGGTNQLTNLVTCLTPHIHFLSSEIPKEEIKRIAPIKFFISPILNCKDVGKPWEDNLRRIVGYFLDQNHKPLLSFRPKKKQLLTASKPFRIGKPYKYDNIEKHALSEL